MNYAERTSPASGLPARQREPTTWLHGLPAKWREQVITPFDIDRFVEYEMAASRCLGYDIDGALCFYSHDYAVEESRSDDDEEFYRVVTHSETVRAWRLRDDRWLIFRQQPTGDDCAPPRGFFMLADHPPRECRP